MRKALKSDVFFVLFLVVAFVVVASLSPTKAKPKKKTPASYARIYHGKELAEAVLGRNGNVVVEKVNGACLDESGHGKVFDDGTSNFAYLSYEGIPCVHAGDLVTTYVVYDASKDWSEDLIARYDVVTKSENFG